MDPEEPPDKRPKWDAAAEGPMRRCLPIADHDTDVSRPPATAEEYLLRVRKEARTVRDVLVADNPQPRPARGSRRGCVPKALCQPYLPPALVPHPRWRARLLAHFSHFRDALLAMERRGEGSSSGLPSGRIESEWKAFCLPQPEGRPPAAALVVGMDHVLVNWLLQRQVLWAAGGDDLPRAPPYQLDGMEAALDVPVVQEAEAAAEGSEVPADPAPAPAIPVASAAFLRRLARRNGLGCWLYALLGRVDVPLVPDNQTALQDLLRGCCRARLALAAAGLPPAAPLAALLNVFIV
eukprot:EG_transcript_21887